MNLLRKAKGIMNRNPYRDPSLTPRKQIIGSCMICKGGAASLIKSKTPLIGLPDDYLVCKDQIIQTRNTMSSFIYSQHSLISR